MSGRSPNEHGFTLIEMLIVILIISILLLIAVPNMAKNNDVVKDKSCNATVKLIQSQVAAYEVENNTLPERIEDLSEYIDSEDMKCPGEDGDLNYDPATGKVSRP
ncbi:competence type IV pilus major pilin ComGC [Pseudalkalibacillus salsuginis]|uniref:competence type IV pilus major pilin ComGC n=1 Tax=Pseudalkalibacillus salsuginis TaxID=2910972 RepID=UPI001F4647D3|nr:competence type IV pilus major pilin ComGC [Pseudalkalibacillus salsuginis]MCF6408450.1 prepilin-type N-terminal cleavage/methylation domain-containing protein [Pseudalkalibacillus salsuginis]